ncbi:MAG: hypothetical protein CMF50_05125 [Legionellales bacterium]|nr:hypothetical protein [Legionellales bacterium]|tara:strand:+ start:73800 stop:74489 length:690 start_codon:yes stop_codon:yes gene_type:complete
MNDTLFNASIKFNETVKRNITTQAPAKNAFASLLDNDDDPRFAQLAIDCARRHVARRDDISDFTYTAAIEYPFKTVPYMRTRFSDGSFPVWYGSRTVQTTVFETVYHSLKSFNAIDGLANHSPIIKKRSVYNVHCDALLINFVGKELPYPQLISDDYQFTNELGYTIKQGGYPGVLSRAARDPYGENISIFRQNVLSAPELFAELSYVFDYDERKVGIYGLEEPASVNF